MCKNFKVFPFIFMMVIMHMFFICSSQVMASSLDFTVDAELPDNQIDKSISYFDLLVSPGNNETLSLTVMNQSNKAIKIKVETTTAVTNENGIIDYSQTKPMLDPNLKYPLSTLMDKIPPIILKGNEAKKLKIPLKIPDESFDGSLLGGLKFTQESTDDSNTKSKIQVENEFFYIVGVRLRVKEKSIKSKIKLEDVFVGNRHNQAVFLVTLKNTTPTIIKPLTIEYSISDANRSKVILEDKQTGFSMAPVSEFNYAIDLQGKNFKKGEYLLHMSVTSGKNTWSFNKKFTLSEKQTHNLNSYTEEKKSYTWIWLVMLSLSLFLLLFISKVFFLN